jgi:hypothetical protein
MPWVASRTTDVTIRMLLTSGNPARRAAKCSGEGFVRHHTGGDKNAHDSREIESCLRKMSLAPAHSYKNVLILGRQNVAVLFVFIHIVASFVVFNILFCGLAWRVTYCPKIRHFPLPVLDNLPCAFRIAMELQPCISVLPCSGGRRKGASGGCRNREPATQLWVKSLLRPLRCNSLASKGP